MRSLIAILVAAASIAGGAGVAAAAETRTVAAVVNGLVDDVIIPAYREFEAAAGAQAEEVAILCETPSSETLASARAAFGPLVVAYAAIEPYRFGPAQRENRYERLFFWPDRRGRGLRQIQRVIGAEDETATTVERLVQKSVAVQGLPALEFNLFGGGSDELASGSAFRCSFALAVATAIEMVGAEMAAEWSGDFRQTIASAGPDNPVYRTPEEALQDILSAAATQLELAGVHKVGAVVGETPADARPKRAPFWRAGLPLDMVVANVAAVRGVLEGGVADLLEDDALVNSALFELSQVDRALKPFAEGGEDLAVLLDDEASHRRLAYAAIPLGAGQSIIGERIQSALGLITGFNALDGD
ncbi:MAG: imelysin family protein [Pseudomonadota bacterium]